MQLVGKRIVVIAFLDSKSAIELIQYILNTRNYACTLFNLHFDFDKIENCMLHMVRSLSLGKMHRLRTLFSTNT